jgi:hypothetical protein
MTAWLPNRDGILSVEGFVLSLRTNLDRAVG